MGLKRVTKKFLKYLIPTLLVLLIIPISEINRKSNESKDIFGEGPIRCAIKLKDKLSDGYQTGYCYEMMERLAASLEGLNRNLYGRGGWCLFGLTPA